MISSWKDTDVTGLRALAQRFLTGFSDPNLKGRAIRMLKIIHLQFIMLAPR